MKIRAFWIISSVLALGESAPTLDHAVLERIHEQTAYEFEIRAHGTVHSNCQQGESRVRVAPLKTYYVGPDDEEYQLVRIQSRVCTEFGYRRFEKQIYLPSELMKADSDLSRGVWQSKTYTDVPSLRHPGTNLTLQVERLGPDELKLTWISDPFEEPEFSSMKMTFASPEFISAVENWRPGLLPWSGIYFDHEDPFLRDPLVMDGKLGQITRSERT